MLMLQTLLLALLVLVGAVLAILRRRHMSQLDAIRSAIDINTQAVKDNTDATNRAVAALANVTPVDPAEVDALVNAIHNNSTAVAQNTANLVAALPKPSA